MTSKTGQVKWRGAVDAFGQMVSTASAINSPLRFAGQYQDNETGYYQNYFRDYNSRTGRYLQSDPIGLAGGINRFAYVSGSPTRYIDPYGLEECGCENAPVTTPEEMKIAFRGALQEAYENAQRANDTEAMRELSELSQILRNTRVYRGNNRNARPYIND